MAEHEHEFACDHPVGTNVSDPKPMDYVEEPKLVAAGGWRAPWPSYDFPEVTVARGGINFTTPKRKPMTKKQLRLAYEARLDAITALRKENEKLRKKLRRAMRLIERSL